MNWEQIKSALDEMGVFFLSNNNFLFHIKAVDNGGSPARFLITHYTRYPNLYYMSDVRFTELELMSIMKSIAPLERWRDCRSIDMFSGWTEYSQEVESVY